MSACLILPAASQEPTTAVVVVEGLTWGQIEQGEYGALYAMARHGAVGLMSLGNGGDRRTRFVLTLQTGRRHGNARGGGLIETLVNAGVSVTVHHEPPTDAPLLRLSIPQILRSPEASLQIWWVRAQPGTISLAVEKAVGSLNPERDRVLIVGLPLHGERLAPVIAAGSGLSAGVLTSATTQTPGLVSDEDLAPTLLQWQGIRSQVGQHPIRVIPDADGFAAVQRLARLGEWNALGIVPVGILQVGGGLMAVLTALWRLQGRATSRRTDLLLSVAIGSLLSLPAGTVLAPYLPTSTFWHYLAAIVLSAVWLSLLAHWGAWHKPFRAYIRACALSVIVVIADGVSSQHGIRSSLYSAYMLSGIRFYGIGNELMGVLVGCALAWGLYGLSPSLRAALWVMVAVVLANPAWGANLGGLMTATVGLGCAWNGSHIRSQELVRRLVVWLAIGIAAATLVLWLDSLSASPTHLGETWLRWQAGGWNAVVDTVRSKLTLMARLLLSPFTWGVMTALSIALWALHRHNVLRLRNNDWHGDKVKWLVCVGTAFAFNDSGFVPAATILGVGVGAMLTRQLEEVCRGSST